METPRHELKYFINLESAGRLSGLLGRVLARDSHANERGEYMIRSLYFDDAFNTAYNDKLDGVEHRDKYRVRIYNMDGAHIFLERKRKNGDLITKTGVRVTRRLYDQLLDGDATGLSAVNNALIRDMYAQMRLLRMRPAVIVDYEREAFVHPAGHVRITIDKRVRSGVTSLNLFDERLPTVPVIDPDLAVLEVKYDSVLPGFIAPLLGTVPAQRSAISKYVLCRKFAP